MPATPDDHHISVNLIEQIRHLMYLRLIVAGLRRPPAGAPQHSLALYLTARPGLARVLVILARRVTWGIREGGPRHVR